MSDVTLYAGDCLSWLRADENGYDLALGYGTTHMIADGSIDAIVTDPPYGLEFMGKDWDSFRGDAWRNSAGMTATGYTDGGKRLARPSFGGSDSANPTCATCGGRKRGAKKCACACPEWRVKGQPLDQRDNNAAQMRAFGEWCELWATECLRVLKPGGHMLAFGGTRTFHRLACAVEDAGFEVRDSIAWLYGSGFPKSLNLVDDDGERTGWGTALKPAFEPIVVARKPLVGTVALNVLAHGTGALNIDGCRVATSDALGGGAEKKTTTDQKGDDGWTRPWMSDESAQEAHAERVRANVVKAETLGRWPANVVLDESQAEVLDDQSGTLTSGANPTRRGSDKFGDAYGDFVGREECTPARGVDVGGASRFFYTAKAGADERVRIDGVAHPTVKPLALMRWLVRLVTPAGGKVLDLFAGSGTTVEACILEDFDCVAMERELTYVPLIQQRIDRRRDPVAAVRGSSTPDDDLGLFGLLDGTGA